MDIQSSTRNPSHSNIVSPALNWVLHRLAAGNRWKWFAFKRSEPFCSSNRPHGVSNQRIHSFGSSVGSIVIEASGELASQRQRYETSKRNRKLTVN